MSNQATLNFEQALPHLRRGFILRIHGSDAYEGAQLQEESGKLQLGFGDGKWESAADLPLLDLSFDVYDKKPARGIDVHQPLVERDANAVAVTQQLADAKAGAELQSPQALDAVSEEQLRTDALRILRDNGIDSPTDEQVEDMVLQLKQKADALDPVTEQAGGNTPATPEIGAESLTQGLNEQQTDQVDPVPEPLPAEEQYFDGEPEGDELPDETTQVADGSDGGSKKKRKKH